MILRGPLGNISHHFVMAPYAGCDVIALRPYLDERLFNFIAQNWFVRH